jgi:alpha-aminoadipate/glutamate carrier protein LysW
MIYCPECETNLDIDDDSVDEGEVVACPECGSEYEVVTINPIELKQVEEGYEEEEEEEETEDSDYS